MDDGNTDLNTVPVDTLSNTTLSSSLNLDPLRSTVAPTSNTTTAVPAEDTPAVAETADASASFASSKSLIFASIFAGLLLILLVYTITRSGESGSEAAATTALAPASKITEAVMLSDFGDVGSASHLQQFGSAVQSNHARNAAAARTLASMRPASAAGAEAEFLETSFMLVRCSCLVFIPRYVRG
jgi:hypothetical protein